MFDIFDLKYLFSFGEDDSRSTYRQDSKRNTETLNKVQIHNKNFSETFFTSWITNIILKYIKLRSDNNSPERITRFEKYHFTNQKQIENLCTSNEFDNIDIKFVDFVEFLHTSEHDLLSLVVCITCKEKTSSNDSNPLDDDRIFYYGVELEKLNNDSTNENNTINTEFTSNCPNCGAPTKIETFGRCDHCHEIVSIYDSIWKIRKLVFID